MENAVACYCLNVHADTGKLDEHGLVKRTAYETHCAATYWLMSAKTICGMWCCR